MAVLANTNAEACSGIPAAVSTGPGLDTPAGAERLAGGKTSMPPSS